MKKKEIRISVEKIGKYLRELSVVVIGISITFTINNWINNRSEKRDMNLYLSVIKVELEENLEALLDLKEHFESADAYSNYLNTHDKTLLNEDSLYSYKNIQYNCYNVTFSTTAFEMFKTSGYMRFIKDKEFIKSIWKIYDALVAIDRFTEAYTEEKKKSVFIDIENDEVHKKEIEKHTWRTIPMYDFFVRNGYGVQYSMIKDCNKISDKINEALPKF
jgi:hypothetical protein